MTELLVHDLRYSTMTLAVKDVLNSSFSPPQGMDYYTNLWFQHNVWVQPPPGQLTSRPLPWISTKYHIKG